MSKFKELLEGNRFFKIQHESLILNNEVDEYLLDNLISYFLTYINFYKLDNNQIYEKQINFLKEYNAHVRKFIKTNEYPYLYNENINKSRIDYDIPLLCSVFLSFPRYRIFELINKRSYSVKTDLKTCIVGVGTGIELFLLQSKLNNISAFDTDISIFLRKQFEDVMFIENKFKYVPDQKYFNIFLIEILEHLENPFILLNDAMKSLHDDGTIYFTTAVNIPQFDHLYNFKLLDEELKNCIGTAGFMIHYKEEIPHNNIQGLFGYSCYYEIKKEEE